jgi:23S rRNA U2552 (ribose-2'-O)-methylase RlmE/FtsJ
MFSAYMSTRVGAATEIVVTDADPQHIADLVELLKADAERQRCAIDALAQHHLFGDSEEVR